MSFFMPVCVRTRLFCLLQLVKGRWASAKLSAVDGRQRHYKVSIIESQLFAEFCVFTVMRQGTSVWLREKFCTKLCKCCYLAF